MIRTTLSVLVLFGSLLILSALLSDSKADNPGPSSKKRPAEVTVHQPTTGLRERLRSARYKPANQPSLALHKNPRPLRDADETDELPTFATPASDQRAVDATSGRTNVKTLGPPPAVKLSDRDPAAVFDAIRNTLDELAARAEARLAAGANSSTPRREAKPPATLRSLGDLEDGTLPGFIEIGEDEAAEVPSLDSGDEPTAGNDGGEADLDDPPAPHEEPPAGAFEPVQPTESTTESKAKPAGEGSEPVVIPLPEELSLTPELIALRERVRDCLAFHHSRPETTSERSPWGIMHALISFGVDSEILADGRRANAASWLCWNGSCRGMRMMYVRGGQLEVRQGPGYQGHQSQFLAILAQCRVPSDYPLRVDGRQFTVQDLVEYEKANCRPKTELTFTLIGLAHYLDSDDVWRSRQGQTWNIERLIREELAQPIVGAACGGTHRMMSFSYAVRKRTDRGEPITGQWLRAKEFVEAYHEYTFSMQNPDGSFSTEWFERRASEPSIERRLQTTGHILEWLAYSLPKDELRSPRMVRAVDYLTTLMLENPRQKWEVGPRGHALRALTLYDERLFGGVYGQREKQLAEHRESRSLR